MLIERLTFNMLAFCLLIIMVAKMIRRNDNIYMIILGGQALGITVNFLELIKGVFVGYNFKIITYVLSIIIPLGIIILELKKIYFSELIYVFLSKIAYLTKNYKACKNFLDRLIKVCPKSYYGHKMLAELYEKEGGLRKAIDEYVELIEIKPNDYDSYYKIGVLLDDLHKKDEAVTILNNLLRKKPDYYKASDLLGIILCEQEKYKQALNVYQEALKYNPASFELYYNLAIVHTRLNDFQNAKECYEMAADINHELYNAHYSLGQIYLIYHDLDAAEQEFTKSLYGKETEHKAYYQLSKLALLRGDKEKAILYIENAIQLDEEYVNNVKNENIFAPIKEYILGVYGNKKLVQDKEEQADEECRENNTKEEEIEEHLSNTLDLFENLNSEDKNENKEEYEYENQDVLDQIANQRQREK